MSNEPTASDAPQPASHPPSTQPQVDPHVHPQPGYYWPVYVDPRTGYVLPYASHGWNEQKLHPATIVVQIVRFLKSIGLLLIIAIAMRLAGKRADSVEVIATLLGAFSIAGAVLKYVSFRYSIVGDSLHVRSGLIFRQDRAIPLERIQNINVRQELVHRMLGVADVQIETASGGAAAEASLSVVSLAEAERLRAALSQRTAPQAVETQATAGDVVYRARLRDLVLAGATTNRLGTLLAAALGVFVYVQAIVGREDHLVRALKPTFESKLESIGWPAIAGGIAALVLLGWLTSIVLTIVGKFGFQLVRVQGQLERSFGLTTRHHSIFPVQRVQMLRIRSPILQRQFGLCHIGAETAGSFRDQGKGHDAGSTELCPILPIRRADEMCRLALPGFSFDALRWSPTAKLARWRIFVRICVALTLLLSAGLYFEGATWAWASLGLVPIVALLVSGWQYRAIGFALQDGFLATRSGVWMRTVRALPLGKVQASFVTQSPLQWKLGLATLRVLTAGAGFGATASVPDLQLATAIDLQERIGGSRRQIIEEAGPFAPATLPT